MLRCTVPAAANGSPGKQRAHYLGSLRGRISIQGQSRIQDHYICKRFIKEGKGKTPTEIAPGTKVYELVEELAKYLPEEQRRHFMG